MNFKKQKLIAGLLYVSLLFVGPFTLLIFPELFQGQEDLALFKENNMSILYIWIFLDILIIAIEIVLSTLLYKLLKPFNNKLALAAYIARLSMVVVMVLSIFLLGYITFNGDLTSIELLDLFNLHHSGIYLWGFGFFAHLLVLGYISLKNSNLNSILGYGLLIGSFGYLIDSITFFTSIESSILSGLNTILLVIVSVSEISFGIWLIFTKKESF